LETFVLTGKVIPAPDPLPELFSGRAGCFVTLMENGELRGCIGTIEPVYDNLALEIINNAIAAGTEDPRFPPVSADELPYLDYTVEVLGPLNSLGIYQSLIQKCTELWFSPALDLYVRVYCCQTLKVWTQLTSKSESAD